MTCKPLIPQGFLIQQYKDGGEGEGREEEAPIPILLLLNERCEM